ncbi:hypothetical protein KAR91_68940 [Candidatus Pacearchaeota archaeon]|nr:hypothetical protein [Candidatus Pacearchaeota archaeon]
MSEKEITRKYKYVSVKELHEMFILLQGNDKHAKEIKMVDKLMMFLSEYNSPRPFSYQPMRKVIANVQVGGRYQKQEKMVLDGKKQYFWSEQAGAVHRKPWWPELKGLKIRADHWLADREKFLKMIGIKK